MKQITLETERLILRPLSVNDFDAVYAYESDYETVKFMYALSFKPGYVVPEENTYAFLQECETEWQKDVPAFYEFAVVEKVSKKLIGHIAAYHLDTDQMEAADEMATDKPEVAGAPKVANSADLHEDPVYPACELGWIFNRASWGKGYCTEAALKIKQFALETLGVKKLVAHCDTRNAASRRVMEKLGMHLIWDDGPRVYPNTGEEATEAMYALDIKDDKNEN